MVMLRGIDLTVPDISKLLLSPFYINRCFIKLRFGARIQIIECQKLLKQQFKFPDNITVYSIITLLHI
jgi:hypothetical protein